MFSTDRSIVKMILLGILTFGIYPIVVISQMAEDINIIAFPHDGKKTMSFPLVFFIFGMLTAGIADFVWFSKFSTRIKDELARRGIVYKFGARTFWLWYVLGIVIYSSLIAPLAYMYDWYFLGLLCFIGPIVYTCKLIGAVNRICEDYNDKGE